MNSSHSSTCSFTSFLSQRPHLLTTFNSISTTKKISNPKFLRASAFSYHKFLHFALNETRSRTLLLPSPLQDSEFIENHGFEYTFTDQETIVELPVTIYIDNTGILEQENYNTMAAMDGKTELQMLSFQTSKIRLLRSLNFENEGMQVLDFAVFARPEFDVPIFCANFFTASDKNIVVLDLNPLHNAIDRKDYKEKYYQSLLPLGLKYAELFPWGGKLTGESLQFFSPIVVWSRFTSSQSRHDFLYSAFFEYYKAWLKLIEQAAEETDASRIMCNSEAQHKYLTWRAEKDPGHRVLKKLVGEDLAKDLVRNFLFNGLDELGNKGFLDYFPEYQLENGEVNEKRSMIGKSYENRPWDSNGEFIGNM